MRTLASTMLLVLCAFTHAQQPVAVKADRVVVLKKERKLELLSQGKVVKTYKVALGGEPVGAKARQGDHRTPEGSYLLDRRNLHSQFYKSVNAAGRARAAKLHVSPGGDVFIDGTPNAYGWVGGEHRLTE